MDPVISTKPQPAVVLGPHTKPAVPPIGHVHTDPATGAAETWDGEVWRPVKKP